MLELRLLLNCDMSILKSVEGVILASFLKPTLGFINFILLDYIG